MPHRYIDPMVDCIFKAILGVEENVDLLQDFLNAIIQPEVPFVSVRLMDPFNLRDGEHAKLSVVDVKATDATGRVFQIEVQLALHDGLRRRILFTWADQYRKQIKGGGRYHKMRPVISIWLLRGSLFDCLGHHTIIRPRAADGEVLHDDMQIHVLETGKFQLPQGALDPEARWLYFFKDGGTWDSLPAAVDTPVLRKAMSVVRDWSQEDKDYWRYRARVESARVQREFEETNRELKEERAALLAEKESLVSEKESLAADVRALAADVRTLAAANQALAEQNQEVLAQMRDLRARLEAP